MFLQIRSYLLFFLGIFIVLTGFLSHPAHAKEKKVYRIGVENIPFMPYSEVRNGNYAGIFRELIDAFAQREDITIEWLPLPLNRLYLNFYEKRIDLKVPSNPYWQSDIKKKRGLDIVYSKAIVKYTDGVMVKRDKPGTHKLESLKTLGVVAGFTPWKYLEFIKSGQISVKENGSIQGILGQGILGRVDGIYINIDVGRHYLRNELKQEGDLRFESKLPYIASTYHMAALQDNRAIITRFDEFLAKERKLLDRIIKKFLSRKQSP